MLNRLDLLRRAVINISKNLMAFGGVFCLFAWGFFCCLLHFCVCRTETTFRSLSVKNQCLIAVDIQIGAV